MLRRPPDVTRTCTLVPSPTLFRSPPRRRYPRPSAEAGVSRCPAARSGPPIDTSRRSPPCAASCRSCGLPVVRLVVRRSGRLAPGHGSTVSVEDSKSPLRREGPRIAPRARGETSRPGSDAGGQMPAGRRRGLSEFFPSRHLPLQAGAGGSRTAFTTKLLNSGNYGDDYCVAPEVLLQFVRKG